ncbi:MAG: RpnC/YadD family protein [Bacilli bacterium]
MSDLNGDAALDEVTRHLQADERHPEDRLRLALALSMDVRDREQAFERVLALVPKVSDEVERDLVVAALLTFGDRELGDAQRERLRKELRKVSKIAQELREEGREEGEAKKAVAVARAMLAKGLDVALVSEVTGLPAEELEQLRKELSN